MGKRAFQHSSDDLVCRNRLCTWMTSTTLLLSKMNEADTCRTYVVPKLQSAGWENAPFSIAEQRFFTNPKGRIRIVGGRIVRGKPKRVDYLLRYRRDFPIAVVEAKADYKTPRDRKSVV